MLASPLPSPFLSLVHQYNREWNLFAHLISGMVWSRSVLYCSRTSYSCSRWQIFIPHCPEKEQELLQVVLSGDQEKCFPHTHLTSIEACGSCPHLWTNHCGQGYAIGLSKSRLSPAFPPQKASSEAHGLLWGSRCPTSWQDSGSEKKSQTWLLVVFAGATEGW